MGSYPFTQQKRLLKAQEYRQVFDQASYKISDRHMLILATANQFGQSRLGVIIAKKNIRLAVNRNRIKRLLRESFRHQTQFPISVDLVVMARSGINDLSNTELRQLLECQWQRLIKRLLKISYQT